MRGHEPRVKAEDVSRGFAQHFEVSNNGVLRSRVRVKRFVVEVSRVILDASYGLCIWLR